MKSAIAYIDGSGNSPRIHACAVTLSMDGRVYEETELLPPNTKNNVGEYSGLLLCLRFAKQLGVQALEVRSDSRLIVEQTNGRWKVKDQNLAKLREQAWILASEFLAVSISWVPREENKRADALCRSAVKTAEAAARPFARPRPPVPSAR